MSTVRNVVAAVPVTVPASPPSGDWYHRIVDDPVNIISISLAIVAVALGIIPLILWVVERKKSRLLDQTVKQFAILEKIQELQGAQEKKTQLSQEKLKEIESKAQVMREDVEQRLPNAAMTAYYENTIPQLELQILELGARLQAMRESLNRILGVSVIIDPAVQKILASEISHSVGARRSLEQQQLMLVLTTSILTVIVTVVPYPISIIALSPPVIITIYICFLLLGTARVAFPDSKVLSSAFLRPRTLAIVLAVFLISAVILGAFLWLVFRIRD